MDEMIPAWRGDDLVAVEKLAVHRLGLRHKAVSVFVMRGTQVLVQQRATGKYHSAGLWANTCCTHPRWGEDPRDCATRRLREELGITGLAPVHTQRLEYRADVGCGLIEHEVVDIFVAQANGTMTLQPDPTEVSATRWVELADLARDIHRDPRPYTRWLAVYLDTPIGLIFRT